MIRRDPPLSQDDLKEVPITTLKLWLTQAVKLQDYEFAAICKKELEFNPMDK